MSGWNGRIGAGAQSRVEVVSAEGSGPASTQRQPKSVDLVSVQHRRRNSVIRRTVQVFPALLSPHLFKLEILPLAIVTSTRTTTNIWRILHTASTTLLLSYNCINHTAFLSSSAQVFHWKIKAVIHSFFSKPILTLHRTLASLPIQF